VTIALNLYSRKSAKKQEMGRPKTTWLNNITVCTKNGSRSSTESNGKQNLVERDDLRSYWRRLKAGKKRPLQYVLSFENAGEEQHLASLLRLDERTDPLSFSLVRLRHILAVLDVSEDRWCINVIRSQSVCAPRNCRRSTAVLL